MSDQYTLMTEQEMLDKRVGMLYTWLSRVTARVTELEEAVHMPEKHTAIRIPKPEYTFTTQFLERAARDPQAVAGQLEEDKLTERQARLIAGLANQVLWERETRRTS